MNKILTIISAIVLLLISCGEKEKVVEVPADCPPAAPRGVYAVNLDTYVEICWYPNTENDIAGYDVYRGLSLYGDYTLIGTVPANEYCFDDTDTDNGIQHYYAVVAYDRGGLESDLSYEEVTGTPRPDGIVLLYDRCAQPNASGYDLSSRSSIGQAYDSPSTDFYFDVCGQAPFIIANSGVEIQDYGFVGNDYHAINYAPTEGWSPSGSAEAIAKHCYILRLLEGDGFHYAKLYVSEVTTGFANLWWAYQLVPGNRDLAPPAPGRGAGLTTSSYRPEAKPGLDTEKSSMRDSATPPIVERVTRTRDSESEQHNTH